MSNAAWNAARTIQEVAGGALEDKDGRPIVTIDGWRFAVLEENALSDLERRAEIGYWETILRKEA